MMTDSPLTSGPFLGIGPNAVFADIAIREHQRLWVDSLKEFREQCRIAEAVDDVSEKALGAMTAYLADVLPPEGCEMIDWMLETFPGFRLVYANLMTAWEAASTEREVTAAEVDAAYARFRLLVGRR